MRTTNEVMSETLDMELYDEGEIRASTLHNLPATQVRECMKQYAREVIDHILSHPEMIYVDESGEAVYGYDKFNELKNNLK